MITAKRRPFQIGGSKGVTLPGGMIIGDEISMAADRLLLMDTTGQIPESKLLEFLTEHLEPMFWRWWEFQKCRQPVTQGGGIRPQQAESSVTPREARVVLPPSVLPGSPVYDVTCPCCGRPFRWDLSQGNAGFCPNCGLPLRFRL